MISEYHDVFTLLGNLLPLTNSQNLTQHEIKTTDENPIHIKQYHLLHNSHFS